MLLSSVTGTLLFHGPYLKDEQTVVYINTSRLQNCNACLTRSGRDLLNMAKKRTNVVPIIEDARHPHK